MSTLGLADILRCASFIPSSLSMGLTRTCTACVNRKFMFDYR